MAQRLNRRRAMPTKKASGPGGPQSKPPSGPGGPQSKPKAGPGGPQSKPKAKALPRRRAQAVKPKAKTSPKAKALPRRRAQAVSKPSKPKKGMLSGDEISSGISAPKFVDTMPSFEPKPAPKRMGNSRTKGIPKGVNAPRPGDPNYRRRDTGTMPLPRVINDIPGPGMNNPADRRNRTKPRPLTPPEQDRMRRRKIRTDRYIDQLMNPGQMDSKKSFTNGITRRRYI